MLRSLAMNVNGTTQRTRGPSNPAGLGPGARPPQDLRNGSNASSSSGMPNGNDRSGSGSQLSGAERAERFEDEKRRIIETCFSKRDPDGTSQLSLLPCMIYASLMYH